MSIEYTFSTRRVVCLWDPRSIDPARQSLDEIAVESERDDDDRNRREMHKRAEGAPGYVLGAVGSQQRDRQGPRLGAREEGGDQKIVPAEHDAKECACH